MNTLYLSPWGCVRDIYDQVAALEGHPVSHSPAQGCGPLTAALEGWGVGGCRYDRVGFVPWTWGAGW